MKIAGDNGCGSDGSDGGGSDGGDGGGSSDGGDGGGSSDGGEMVMTMSTAKVEVGGVEGETCRVFWCGWCPGSPAAALLPC